MEGNKLTSRKFLIWLTSTILVIGSLITATITNNDTLAEVSKTFADGWVVISGLYIGGNVAQKFATNKSTNEELEQ